MKIENLETQRKTMREIKKKKEYNKQEKSTLISTAHSSEGYSFFIVFNLSEEL